MNAKTKSKADSKGDAPAAPKKNMLVIAIAGAVIAAAGGGAAWFFTQSKADAPAAQASAEPAMFVPLDAFVVNLQPEEGNDAYLQIGVTLQVPSLEAEELLKQNMPKVRSRVLMLLSGKHKSEITTVEGKRQLANDIIAALKEPFVPKGKPQEVSEVLFTTFIVQ